ncbi:MULTISPECIES: S41 family peptidase [unclassified Streptomyces]|uniref:S41 family peptidase n=1 Tax=Streptomyces TaxID=1883 RepID=UPI0013705681|nr:MULTISPECIES: S41 family peptidase [unclassified Streptomyces]NEA01325.1 peptidase S41 [Streptomyces sp. SID10116]MYY83940.1 peptidase S41 [Streptomyces sp. SID335]MYZ16174.1 peptidase S41 [Streptomyces sp. SID337]NDZ84142.1 peptidase S41 [Streptomyces sp. SID10115]NEB44649.1 peptidase S41 [Streptomyces sp. SID339]
MRETAHDYLARVLNLIQENALNRRKVDWGGFRREAYEAIADAASPSDAYGQIRKAIAALNDPHTFFLTPDDVAGAFGEEATTAAPVPSGRLVDGRYPLVVLPEATGVEEADRRYVETGAALVRELDAHRPGGWIVDLRGNTGGNMYPMMTVLAPLLADGLLGSFVDGDGQTTGRWNLRDGIVHHDEEAMSPVPNPYRLTAPDIRVAVLIDGRTMSAAEATLIAFLGKRNVRTFGEPTAGLATGNAAIELSDGAMLVLTAVREADRLGRVYGDAPIQPDEIVPTQDALTPAVAWLQT